MAHEENADKAREEVAKEPKPAPKTSKKEDPEAGKEAHQKKK